MDVKPRWKWGIWRFEVLKLHIFSSSFWCFPLSSRCPAQLTLFSVAQTLNNPPLTLAKTWSISFFKPGFRTSEGHGLGGGLQLAWNQSSSSQQPAYRSAERMASEETEKKFRLIKCWTEKRAVAGNCSFTNGCICNYLYLNMQRFTSA